MNEEELAEAIAEVIDTIDAVSIETEPMENVTGGGHFFNLSLADGRLFTVLVREVGA